MAPVKQSSQSTGTDHIHPLLDPEKQIHARKYDKENRLLGLAGSLLTLGFLLLYYYSGFSFWVANRFPQHHTLWAVVLYFSIFYLFLTVVELPLSYYSGYVHEKKWGFSNHTPRSWLWDKTKSFLVGLMLSFLILGFLFWVMAYWPGDWWWITGLSAALIGIVFASLFPIVILPLFNKYTPIEDAGLIRSLSSILSKAGLRSGGFFKQDTSRQTKKENAFLAGLGKTRRVVLADNLMENMSPPEIESVIAHEVGHYKHHHLWKNIFLGSSQQLAVFFILNVVLIQLLPHFLESTRWNLTYFPLFVLLMGLISGLLFGPLSNWISRYFERQADRVSLDMIADRKSFLTAMAGLANRNLSNAYPPLWVKILYFSHPPIGERLLMGEHSNASH